MDIAVAWRPIRLQRLRGAVRVAREFLLGLVALSLVRLARRTVGRDPRGLAGLGRFGARVAGAAGPAGAVVAAVRARRTVPAYRSATEGLRPWSAAGSLHGNPNAYRGESMATSGAMPPEFSIGTLAAMSGIKIETVRYYERIGLMPKPLRSAAGYRRYTGEHLKRLIFIRRGRELAFSLEVLRDLLRLVDGHAHTCAEGRALALEHLDDIRGKIADLKRLECAMAEIASRCSGKPVPDCALVDALFGAPPSSAQIQPHRSPHVRIAAKQH